MLGLMKKIAIRRVRKRARPGDLGTMAIIRQMAKLTYLRASCAPLCLLVTGAPLCLLVSCAPRGAGSAAPSVSVTDDSPGAAISAVLDAEKQKYIWDIEHVAFELEKKFGDAFKAALKNRDAEALQGFCRPDFAAKILDPASQTTIDRGFVRQRSNKTDQALPVGASQLMSHLSDYFADFAEIKAVKFRVLDLHAEDGRTVTGNWSWTLFLSGSGTDAGGAPIEFESEHRLDCHFLNDQGVAAGRILDRWQILSEELRSSQQPLFEEATASVGLDKINIHDNWKASKDRVRQYYSQMAIEDFDRDGFLDLAVASANGRWRLLKSDSGARFKEVNTVARLPAWSGEEPRSRSVEDQVFLATWIDFDNDGFPDLLLGDRLFHNSKGRSFEDVTGTSGLLFSYNPKGCLVADYDCDGLLDLYVLYQLPRYPEETGRPIGWVGDEETGTQNQLWRNIGRGRFINVTHSANAGGGSRQSFAAAWLHMNDDHFPDLYVANDFGSNVLLLNQGNGKFRDVSQAAEVSDYATSMGVAAGDVTGDGRPEIYVANMFSKMGRRIIAHVGPGDYPPGVFELIKGSCAGNRLYSSTSDGKNYEETSEDLGINQVGWAYAPAMADFDADGLLDIYATTGFLSFRRDKPDG
jgi:hypothetical protein